MEITTHHVSKRKIAEVTSNNILISTLEESLNIMADLYYQEFDAIILHEKNIIPLFFDLKTGIAGEILQKFSNYRMRLAIVGDFTKYQSNSFQDFVFESNANKRIIFVGTIEEALERLT